MTDSPFETNNNDERGSSTRPSPFETNENGNYLCIAPAEGMEPEAVYATVDGVTYRLSGYIGKDVTSTAHPDVLAYRYCTVENGGDA